MIIYWLFCQTVNDTAPDVREASFDALGTAMKVVSEKNIALFLTDVDNIKMQKVKGWLNPFIFKYSKTSVKRPLKNRPNNDLNDKL